jgi:GntR family transcriptional repressor for pyruvate dehydrogenase complex
VTTLWQSIKEPGSLTDRIVARIEALIDAERLVPGQRLPAEREMARLLGVSRPAIREAVKVLEERSRVVVRHGQGVFVDQTTESVMRAGLARLAVHIDELFDMRMVLEEPAAAWAASKATDEDIEALRRALVIEERARKPPVDFEHLRELDAGFHMQIVELAKNRFLRQTLGVLHEMLNVGMQTTLSIPGRVELSRDEHRRIFQAIALRDGDAAGRAARRHIEGARDAALARIEEQAAGTADASRGPGAPMPGSGPPGVR